MKRFLMATFMVLWLCLGPAGTAQAQIVYGYSVPFDEGLAASSGMMSSSGGFSPAGMMFTWGSNGSWHNGSWHDGSWRDGWQGRTGGHDALFDGNMNHASSNRTIGTIPRNSLGSRSVFFNPSTLTIPTSMNPRFGGMMNMGMRRR
jgi:hypothetical protein